MSAKRMLLNIEGKLIVMRQMPRNGKVKVEQLVSVAGKRYGYVKAAKSVAHLLYVENLVVTRSDWPDIRRAGYDALMALGILGVVDSKTVADALNQHYFDEAYAEHRETLLEYIEELGLDAASLEDKINKQAHAYAERRIARRKLRK